MGNVNMEATQINYRGGSKKMSVEEAIKAGSALPIASEETLGGVKVGSGLSINSETGVLSNNYQLPGNVIVENDIAYPFNTNTDYYIGDFVFYNHTLYRFETDHTAGEWNSEEVAAVKVCDNIVTDFGDGLNRTGNNLSVKLKNNGGLLFDENGAIYCNGSFENIYDFSNSVQIGYVIKNNNKYPLYRGFMTPPFQFFLQENAVYANFMNPAQWSLPIDERAINMKFFTSGDSDITNLLVIDRSSNGGFLHIYKSFNSSAIEITKVMVEYYLIPA